MDSYGEFIGGNSSSTSRYVSIISFDDISLTLIHSRCNFFLPFFIASVPHLYCTQEVTSSVEHVEICEPYRMQCRTW